MSFSPRERVLAAIVHEEPDRVPLALWGSWYGVTDKLYFNVLETLGWEPVAPFRPDLLHSVNYYDDRLLARLGVNIRHVDPGVTALTARVNDDGFDRWGLQWRKAGLYRTAAYFPLESATVEEIADFALPTPDEYVERRNDPQPSGRHQSAGSALRHRRSGRGLLRPLRDGPVSAQA